MKKSVPSGRSCAGNGKVEGAGNGALGLERVLPRVWTYIHRDREAWNFLEQGRNKIKSEPQGG